ncbi:MAG: NADPH:quinone oxidoreductase family protein [Deltaproteobacteria bacterium]|nr:NADPH:quinone oxidoreductase family protein [Deltaproteobacteria bacterium]MBW2395409.1 NADPH:quinone oxidoreductase family protein [Deltaproteobacteria bacterium]
MRAWQTVKSGNPKAVLAINDDVPVPVPYEGTVLVEVLAAGMGLPDVFMCQGSYAMTPKIPFTQGQEVAGRVIGWADGVENRQIGDRVMAVTSFFTGNGSYAEQCLALDDFCLPVPEGMTDAEGASFLIPFHTAYIGLITRGKLESGETLLVLGAAGGTGTAAIQIAKALGARVIATVAGKGKVEYCKRLGADVVVDRKEQDIAKAVMEATDGKGANCVYDLVGGAAFASATKCVADEGRILMIGFASGSWGAVDTAHLVYQNYSVVGVIPSNYDRAFKEAAQARLLEWWKEGRLKTQIEEMVAFEDLPDALERLAASKVQGKLALKVHPDATAPT